MFCSAITLNRSRDAVDDLQLTEWMLSHGANPNASCYFDITPLSIAAEKASLQVLQCLVNHGALVQQGQALHYAIRSKREDLIVEYLIENGADVNSIMFQNHDRSFHHFKCFGLGTPLHEARGDERLIDLLLKNGADATIPDTKGKLPPIRTYNTKY